MSGRLKPVLGDPLDYGAPPPEERYNCIFCQKRRGSEDTKHHLYVNTDSGFYFCQRCEAKGHISFLLKGREAPPSLKVKKPTLIEQLSAAFTTYPVKEEEPEKVTASLPDDYHSLADYPESLAAKYLLNRGIPLELMIERGIGYGSHKRKGRIILPVFDEDWNCVYWVARSYTNTDHRASCKCFLCKLKYINAPGVHRRDYIYGLEFCQGDDVVCLTEGPISALSAGQNAIATFGKYVTHEQEDVLAKRFKCIQLALDPDAKDTAIALAQRFLKYRDVEVQWVPLPEDKDPNDLGIEVMMNLRANAVILNKFNLLEVILDAR